MSTEVRKETPPRVVVAVGILTMLAALLLLAKTRPVTSAPAIRPQRSRSPATAGGDGPQLQQVGPGLQTGRQICVHLAVDDALDHRPSAFTAQSADAGGGDLFTFDLGPGESYCFNAEGAVWSIQGPSDAKPPASVARSGLVGFQRIGVCPTEVILLDADHAPFSGLAMIDLPNSDDEDVRDVRGPGPHRFDNALCGATGEVWTQPRDIEGGRGLRRKTFINEQRQIAVELDTRWAHYSSLICATDDAGEVLRPAWILGYKSPDGCREVRSDEPTRNVYGRADGFAPAKALIDLRRPHNFLRLQPGERVEVSCTDGEGRAIDCPTGRIACGSAVDDTIYWQECSEPEEQVVRCTCPPDWLIQVGGDLPRMCEREGETAARCEIVEAGRIRVLLPTGAGTVFSWSLLDTTPGSRAAAKVTNVPQGGIIDSPVAPGPARLVVLSAAGWWSEAVQIDPGVTDLIDLREVTPFTGDFDSGCERVDRSHHYSSRGVIGYTFELPDGRIPKLHIPGVPIVRVSWFCDNGVAWSSDAEPDPGVHSAAREAVGPQPAQ